MTAEAAIPPSSRLILYIDGASRGNPGPAGYGVRLASEQDETLEELSGFIGIGTNNVAEYRALLAGLERAARADASCVLVRSDSELLVRQMSGAYKVKSPSLRPLHRRAKEILARFSRVTFEHVPREQNRDADRLANLALDRAANDAGGRGF